MEYYSGYDSPSSYGGGGGVSDILNGYRNRWNHLNPSEKLLLCSKVTFGASLFFWGWALYNTMTMSRGFDLGCVSFLCTLLSSGYLLIKINNSNNSNNQYYGNSSSPSVIMMGRNTKWCISFTHLLVTLNYGLGILFAMTAGSTPYYKFGTYCFIFCGLWLGSTIYHWKLLSILQQQTGGGGGGDYHYEAVGTNNNSNTNTSSAYDDLYNFATTSSDNTSSGGGNPYY